MHPGPGGGAGGEAGGPPRGGVWGWGVPRGSQLLQQHLVPPPAPGSRFIFGYIGCPPAPPPAPLHPFGQGTPSRGETPGSGPPHGSASLSVAPKNHLAPGNLPPEPVPGEGGGQQMKPQTSPPLLDAPIPKWGSHCRGFPRAKLQRSPTPRCLPRAGRRLWDHGESFGGALGASGAGGGCQVGGPVTPQLGGGQRAGSSPCSRAGGRYWPVPRKRRRRRRPLAREGSRTLAVSLSPFLHLSEPWGPPKPPPPRYGGGSEHRGQEEPDKTQRHRLAQPRGGPHSICFDSLKLGAQQPPPGRRWWFWGGGCVSRGRGFGGV